MKARTSDLLSEVRKRLKVSFPFSFMRKSASVNEDSENNMTLNNILIRGEEPMFFIKNNIPS